VAPSGPLQPSEELRHLFVRHSRTAAVGAVLAALGLVACSQATTEAPSATPAALETAGQVGPSPTEMAEASSSLVPSASPQPTTPSPDPELRPDDVAQVVTTDLVVRSLPEISERSVMDPVRLTAPTLLFIVDGPVMADGYDWYQVAPFAWEISDIAHEAPGLGWVAAASRDGEAWIEPIAPDCPDPSLEAIQWLSSLARLACFGTQPVTLEGTLSGCGTGGGTASWLGGACQLMPFESEGHVPRGLLLRFHPEGAGSPFDGTEMAVRVIGQFDDPLARTCESFEEPDLPALGADQLILSCRAEFVVSEVVIVDGS
jgi:hypothetical protein